MIKPRLVIAPDAEALARLAAQRIIARLELSPDRPAVCLTGGTTPRRLYEMLGGEFAAHIPWPRVHWFMGDERVVPADDPRSNIGAARRAMLDANAPAENVHAIPTGEATLDAAATAYEQELKAFFGAPLGHGAAKFDVVLMGVGPDGHTASLFPGSPALDERERMVVEVDRASVEPFVPRVTLTLPALAACDEMMFLVAGAEKKPVLTRVFSDDDLPAARATSAGRAVWLIDRAALPETVRES